MRRILLLICSVLACVASASAYSFLIDGIAYDLSDSGSTLVVTYTSLDETNYAGATDVVIPEAVIIDDVSYKVVAIGDFAFYGSPIESIKVPSSVRSIGDRALAHCSKLSSIIVAENSSYFDGLEMCNAIIDTNSCTLIAGCSSTVIPSTVDDIAPFAFSGCKGLRAVTIPSTVGSIGYEAFEGTGITSIVIPSSVTQIGYRAFAHCEDLSSISVDTRNRKYDSRDNCNAIIETATGSIVAACKATTFPEEVRKIGYEGFGGLAGLDSLKISEGITGIGHYAFRDSPMLKVVDIPSTIARFGDRAFGDCSGLERVFAHLLSPETAEYGNFKTFSGVPVDTCLLIVPDDMLEIYRVTLPWSEFLNIRTMSEMSGYMKGDVNADGSVDIEDVNILINIILDVDSADNYDGRAYIVGNDSVDIEDVNALINIILTQ